MIRREHGTNPKHTGDYFRRWCLKPLPLKEFNSTVLCICRLHLTLLRLLWSLTGSKAPHTYAPPAISWLSAALSDSALTQQTYKGKISLLIIFMWSGYKYSEQASRI